MAQTDLTAPDAAVTQRIHALPDFELVRLIEQRDLYTPEAVTVAVAEAEARGGIAKLKTQTDLLRITPHKRRWGRAAANAFDRVLTWLLGRPPSDRYPALGHVAMTMRVLSFVFGAISIFFVAKGLGQFMSGGFDQWFLRLFEALWSTLAFVLLFGASEVIHLLTDIERNTRESRNRLRRGDQGWHSR